MFAKFYDGCKFSCFQIKIIGACFDEADANPLSYGITDKWKFNTQQNGRLLAQCPFRYNFEQMVESRFARAVFWRPR